jgi:hypothetical protein
MLIVSQGDVEASFGRTEASVDTIKDGERDEGTCAFFALVALCTLCTFLNFVIGIDLTGSGTLVEISFGVMSFGLVVSLVITVWPAS